MHTGFLALRKMVLSMKGRRFSAEEAAAVLHAVWDEDIDQYTTMVRCIVCNDYYRELLTIALASFRGETHPICIKCDLAAKKSSEVSKVIE